MSERGRARRGTRSAPVEDAPQGVEQKPSGVRRLLHIVGAVVVVLVLPALVIHAFVGELGVAAMFTGVLLGAVAERNSAAPAA